MPSGRWQPSDLSEQPGVGFYLASGRGADAIRWSQPAAYVELPLPPGRTTLSLRWLFCPLVQGERPLTFYLDERRVPDGDVRIFADRVEIRADVEPNHGRIRLGWVSSALPAEGDARRLGLPVRSISWRPEEVPLAPVIAPAA
jgi:hypothetical protein